MKLSTITLAMAVSTMVLLSTFSITSHASNIPGAVNDHIPLGTAYNSFTGEFLNFQTVKGKVVERGSTATNILATQNLSYREISSRISGEATVNADFPVVKAEASADIALAAGSDEFSSNWVLSVLNKSKSHVLRGITNKHGLTLSKQGQAIVKKKRKKRFKDSDLLKAAGNEFVTEIEYSSQLMVYMKAVYLSSSDKDAINGNISVDFALGEVSGNLGFLTDEQKQSVTITVAAHQFGGDPLNLLTVIPDNIVTCNLTNFAPCKELFEHVIKYAKGIDQYEGIGFKDQVATVSNSNITGYKTEKYAAHYGTRKLKPRKNYQIDNNKPIIDGLENELVEQLEAKERASNILTKSLAYLNPTQRAALRNTSRVALNNAEALRDLIDYCYSNIYNGDCASFIAKHCPYDSRIDDRSRSCIREYSTKLFDLTNHDELELTLQQYNRLVAPSKSENIGMDLLQMPGVEVFSARNKTRRSITLDKSSGEVMGLGGLEIYSPKSNSKITTSFLIKTKTKLERAKLWPIDSTGSFQVSVYQGEGWKVCQDQDSNNQYDRDVMDGAIAVNGYYYYKYDIKDMETLRMYMDIFKKEDIEITFYRKSTHVTPMTTGLSSDNKPFYFTARNIEVTKDINNNDIGYCLADNNINLMRTTDTGYCKTYGRLYTWDDAIKACEAYSEHHEASTGLFFRLPSNDDYDLYFDRVEQESGVDKVAYWLKSYQFEKHNNQYQTINKLGFNAQAGGRFKSHNNGSYSSSPKGTEGTLWGATEENGSANLVSFDSADKFVTKTFVDKSNLSPVRCIGSFTR